MGSAFGGLTMSKTLMTLGFLLAGLLSAAADDWRGTLAKEILPYLEKAYRS